MDGLLLLLIFPLCTARLFLKCDQRKGIMMLEHQLRVVGRAVLQARAETFYPKIIA